MTTIEKITTMNDSIVLVLSPEMVAEWGLTAGDEVELTMVDKTLTVRPVDDEDADFDAIADQLMEERKHVYEALARGAE
jgi:antitoxin component of MazEF toxin-antitoxin module